MKETGIHPWEAPGLYQWQRECLQKIYNKNAVVSAPTGSGKTRVAYLWMNPGEASKGLHKIFYTVPIKAIANEKYREMTNLYGEENVGIETGDVKKNINAPIVICTQEIYTRKYAHKPIKARIVIDEFHYIFSCPERSRAYIDGIKKAREEHLFLLMSATLGNPEKIISYLKKVTGKDFVLYSTNERPTELVFTQEEYTYEDIPSHSIIYLFNTWVISSLARYLTTKKSPLPLLKRRRIVRIASEYGIDLTEFPELEYGIAKYHSKMTYTQKKFVEKLVEEGYISTILATNALGVGVNLPVKYALFATTLIPLGCRKYKRISKVEFVQLAGRAGRKGYFDTGYVGKLLQNFTPYEPPDELRKTYRMLLDSPMEEPVIQLTIDIEKIIKRETTLEEEIEYVINNSLPKRDEKEVMIEAEIIKNELRSIPDDIRDIFPEFFIPELGISGTISLLKFLTSCPVRIQTKSLPGVGTIKVKKIIVNALKIPVNGENNDAPTLLARRRIARQISGKVIKGGTITIANMKKIEEQIKKIDPFCLI